LRAPSQAWFAGHYEDPVAGVGPRSSRSSH
jgi:hypothetical protein